MHPLWQSMNKITSQLVILGGGMKEIYKLIVLYIISGHSKPTPKHIVKTTSLNL